MRTLALSGTCVLLGACAAPYALNPYVEPTESEPHATLIVKATSPRYPANIRVHHTNAETCADFAPVRTKNGREVEVPAGSQVNFRVPAGKPFGLDTSSQQPGTGNWVWTCRMAGTFLPRAGAIYIGEFAYESPSCKLTIEEVVGASRAAVPVRYTSQMSTSAQRTPLCGK